MLKVELQAGTKYLCNAPLFWEGKVFILSRGTGTSRNTCLIWCFCRLPLSLSWLHLHTCPHCIQCKVNVMILRACSHVRVLGRRAWRLTWSLEYCATYEFWQPRFWESNVSSDAQTVQCHQLCPVCLCWTTKHLHLYYGLESGRCFVAQTRSMGQLLPHRYIKVRERCCPRT